MEAQVGNVGTPDDCGVRMELADVLSPLGDPIRFRPLVALPASSRSAARNDWLSYRVEDFDVRVMLDVGLAHTGRSTVPHDTVHTEN